MRFTYKISAEDYIESSLFVLSTKPEADISHVRIIAASIALLGLSLVLFIPQYRPLGLICFIVVVFLAALPYLVRLYTRKMANDMFKKIEDHEVTLELLPEGLIVGKEYSQMQVPWNTFVSIVITVNYIYLQQNEGTVIIPKKAIRGELLEAIIEELRRYLPN